jgi:hypothetical protein
VLDIAAGTLEPTPGAVKKMKRAAPGFSVRAVERIYRGLCAKCAHSRESARATRVGGADSHTRQ